MPINGFDFPGIVFNQSFDSSPTGTLRTLGVACIGKQYQLHEAEGDNAIKLDQTEYTQGTSHAYQLGSLKKGVSNVIDADKSTQRLVVKNGVWSYATVDDVTLTGNKITFASGVSEFTNGSGASAVTVTRELQAGDPIVLVGSSASFISTILDVDTVTNTITLPSAELSTVGTLRSVKLCVYQDAKFDANSSAITMSIATAGSEEMTLASSITTELGWSFAGLATGTVTGTLETGDFYAEFREVVNTYNSTIGVIDTLKDLRAVLGTPCAENPLALACAFAFLGGNASVVYFISVKDDTVAEYTRALDALSKYSQIYSIIPCTNNADVIKACMSIVSSVSEDEESKIRRALWYGIDTAENPVLWEGKATYVAPDEGTAGTITFQDGVPFVDNTTQTGDYVEFILASGNTVRYAIQSTNGADQVTGITSAISGVTAGTNIKVRIIRTQPTPSDRANDLIRQRKARTTSERGVCVWADGPVYNGELIPSFAVAAAAAGMRSAEPCHRPLSNLGYSFFGLAENSGMGISLLKLIGSNGIWIVANNEDGLPVNKRQITTAVSNNINKDEESIIANMDVVAMDACTIGKEYTGNSNISPALLDKLEDELTIHLENFLIDRTGDAFIGPQLLAYEIIDIHQDSVNLDRVYATYSCTPPKPFNKFYVTMRVI